MIIQKGVRDFSAELATQVSEVVVRPRRVGCLVLGAWGLASCGDTGQGGSYQATGDLPSNGAGAGGVQPAGGAGGGGIRPTGGTGVVGAGTGGFQPTGGVQATGGAGTGGTSSKTGGAGTSGACSVGNPPPMLLGVTWLLEQNDDPTSVMYQRLDGIHVGAIGHSQGGYATSKVGTDSHIHTTAPACGAIGSANLTGPALILCGGQDPYVPCSDHPQGAFDGTSNQPVMLANSLAADHANWITVSGTSLNEIEVAVTTWMRVQLMGDTDLRSCFYGASCGLCQDSAWQVSRKLMDQ